MCFTICAQFSKHITSGALRAAGIADGMRDVVVVGVVVVVAVVVGVVTVVVVAIGTATVAVAADAVVAAIVATSS